MKLIANMEGGQQEYTIAEGVSVVGRDLGCDITLLATDISRRHIEIRFQNGRVSVRDLDSRNGTYVNDRKVQEAEVRPGELVRLGNVVLRFVPTGEQAFGPPRAPAGPADHAIAAAPTVEDAPAVRAGSLDEPLMPIIEDVPQPAGPASVEPAPAQTPPPEEPDPPPEPASEPPPEPAPQEPPPGPDQAEPEQPGFMVGVPDDAGYVEDNEPTPVSMEVESVRPAQSEAGALVPARIGEQPLQARSAEARIIESRPMVRSILTPRLIIILVAVVVLTAAVIGVVLYRKRQEEIENSKGFISIAVYRSNVAKAVGMARDGKVSEAVALLNKLKRFRTRPELHTADQLVEALALITKSPEKFQANWQKAQDAWRHLAEAADNVAVREYAALQAMRTNREALNMGYSKKSMQYLGKGEYVRFFKQVKKISSDSMFLPGIQKALVEARSSLVRRQREQADRQEKSQQWSAAIERLNLIGEHVPGMARRIEPHIERLREYQNQERKIQQVRSLMKRGQIDEARRALNDVPSSGPYALEKKRLSSQLGSRESQRRARSLYDNGRGAEALRILDGVGMAQSALANRIRTVMDLHNTMKKRLADHHFTQARNAAEQIVALERNGENRYRLEAQQYIKNTPEFKSKLARQLMAGALADRDAGRYGKARDNAAQALRLDPRLGEAARFIAAMKKEAIRIYNVEVLQLKDKDPQKALRIAKEVLDRLRPGEPYYLRVLQTHKYLQGKTGGDADFNKK